MADFTEGYSKTSLTKQYSAGRKLLGKLHLQRGQIVLDIGCGTGELAAYAAEIVGEDGKVLGVDPDKERIAFARQKFGGLSNLSFCEAGISEVPEGDSYDVIFSNSVFQWINTTELESPLKKIRELYLKSDGIVGIQAFYSSPTMEKIIECLPKERRENLRLRSTFRSGEEYEKMFRRAGFGDVKWDIEVRRDVHKDYNELSTFCYNSTKGLVDLREASPEKLQAIEWKTTSSGEILCEMYLVMLVARN